MVRSLTPYLRPCLTLFLGNPNPILQTSQYQSSALINRTWIGSIWWSQIEVMRPIVYDKNKGTNIASQHIVGQIFKRARTTPWVQAAICEDYATG